MSLFLKHAGTSEDDWVNIKKIENQTSIQDGRLVCISDPQCMTNPEQLCASSRIDLFGPQFVRFCTME